MTNATAKPPLESLTDSQRKIFDFIVKHISEHGYPPTMKEIGNEVGVWPTAVGDSLKLMEKKGYISRSYGISRGIKVLV